ncbi:MAG: hypothetical protein HYU36_23940 [Planctomycetes bacterium]|nr:hypothetical protein [Planctomycetota bacterium]
MDPEGVREVFYAECAAAPDTGFRSALRSLPLRARFKESFFKGVHLPLTRRLPKRLDFTLQQYTGLHAYDAVALADIDPVVFDAEDLMNLEAYVEGGGGLLMWAGPNSFSKAVRHWGPLRPALPAACTLRPERRTRPWHEPRPVETPPEALAVRLTESHPVTRGLGGPLGVVRRLDALTPAPGAAVLASAGAHPVVLAGIHGHGRIILVSAWPDSDPDGLYRSPGWSDLVRQVLLWLMGRDADLVIRACAFDRSPLPPGEGRTFTLEIDAAAPGPVQARALLSRADPGWLSAGREPQWGPAEERPVRIEGRRVQFPFDPPQPGLWRITLEVHGPGWANLRSVQAEAVSSLGLRVWPRHRTYVTAPRWTFPVQVSAERSVPVQLRIIDFDGQEVFQSDAVQPGPVDLALPELELGDYEVIARAGEDGARLRFAVAKPLERLTFSLGGYGGGDTEERVRWWYDYYRSRGFDTFATNLPESAGPPAGFDPLAFQHYLVQRDGGALWGEYLGAAILSTHACIGAEGTRPTRPCVFDPEYPVRLRDLLEGKFRAASCLPRMTSIEILDEPHLYRGNVCRCERCLALFRERYGYPMPTWDEAVAAMGGRTRDYFEWIVGYATRAFRTGFEMWKSMRKARGGELPTLHHVFSTPGNGHLSIQNVAAQDLAWSPHADFIEFDCYNYMYGHWRASDLLRWNEFHYLMGHFRFLALRNRQRIGFFIQVTDRDVPVAPWDPLRAPSETLYTALGGGAKHFHLMYQGGFTNTQNCREEKFDTFAADVRKVRRASPLLERAQAPRRRIAMAFNYHDRLYRFPPHFLPEGYVGLGFYGRDERPYDTVWPYHKAPINVAEMLFRAFGEVDVIDQSALREGALDDYGGFVLTDTEVMDEPDAEALVRFVERGGSLIADRIPERNLEGKPLTLVAPLFQGETQVFFKDVTITRACFGGGRTLRVSADLNELYSGSVERGESKHRYALKDLVRSFFFDAGLRPHAQSSHAEIEANVLLTPDTVVLVAASHAEERQTTRITIYHPPVPVSCTCDLVTQESVPFTRVTEGIEITLGLDEREGRLIGLYPEMPSGVAVVPDHAAFRRGGRLAFQVELASASGRRVRGDHLLDVCVRDPHGEERMQFGGRLCASNGLLRIDEPLAVNARLGDWTITVVEPFTERQVMARFVVRA